MTFQWYKILNRFTKEDFTFVIDKWHSIDISDFRDLDILTNDEIPKLSKNQILKHILKLVKAKDVKKTAMHQLDLLYVQRYPTKKLWTMCTLEKIPGSEHIIEDSLVFSRRLKQQLKLFYKVDLELIVHRKAFWIYINIHGLRGDSSPFYAVYFPNTTFLAVSGLKAVHKDGFVQAFLNVVDCHSMNMLQLKGYNIFSLFQLARNKYPQGGLEAFTDEIKELATTSHSRTRSGDKRHLSDDEESTDDISFEEEGVNKKRKEMLDSAFGEEDLPILQKVEYKLETKFRGTEYAPGMSQYGGVFKCSVKFEGANVLEGIKNLAKAGLADLPMKEHVGKVHMLARNNFNLRMKTTSMLAEKTILETNKPNGHTKEKINRETVAENDQLRR